MTIKSYLIELQLEDDIVLSKFDMKFFNSLKDKKEIILDLRNGIYHTILFNNKKVGIVGYIKTKDSKIGFVQIIISPKFRGKGFMISEDILAKKYNLKVLLATIKKENVQSIKAHKKIGFIEFPKQKYSDKYKMLSKDKVRLYKKY